MGKHNKYSPDGIRPNKPYQIIISIKEARKIIGKYASDKYSDDELRQIIINLSRLSSILLENEIKY